MWKLTFTTLLFIVRSMYFLILASKYLNEIWFVVFAFNKYIFCSLLFILIEILPCPISFPAFFSRSSQKFEFCVLLFWISCNYICVFPCLQRHPPLCVIIMWKVVPYIPLFWIRKMIMTFQPPKILNNFLISL